MPKALTVSAFDWLLLSLVRGACTGNGNRTRTGVAAHRIFKSCVSTYSTIPAW